MIGRRCGAIYFEIPQEMVVLDEQHPKYPKDIYPGYNYGDSLIIAEFFKCFHNVPQLCFYTFLGWYRRFASRRLWQSAHVLELNYTGQD